MAPSGAPIQANKWILRAPGQRPHPKPKLRLFCIPHAGSGAYVYHAWTNLPEGVEVLPIEIPGRNTRRLEPRPYSVHRLARDMIDGIRHLIKDGIPFAFFGHSLGSLTAFSVVHELQAQGGPLPIAVFLSGIRPPQMIGPEFEVDGMQMHKLEPEPFWEIFKERYGLHETLAHPDMRAIVFPDIQADFKLGETYKPSRQTKLPCPLFVSGGLEDGRYTEEQMEAWRFWVEDTPHYCEVELFPGGHHYLFTEGESDVVFVDHLKERLELMVSQKDWQEFLKSKIEEQEEEEELEAEEEEEEEAVGGGEEDDDGIDVSSAAVEEVVAVEKAESSKIEADEEVKKEDTVIVGSRVEQYARKRSKNGSGNVSKSIASAGLPAVMVGGQSAVMAHHNDKPGIMHFVSIALIFFMFVYML